MFTGIIEEIGTIHRLVPQPSGLRIWIGAKRILDDLKIDQSVAVNGVCLTVVEIDGNVFTADVVAETLHRSTLQFAKINEAVNLERALRLQDRLGGHLVQGHVDGMGIVRQLVTGSEGNFLKIEIPQELERYTIPKGSIAIDGISLTIAGKEQQIFSVAIIPHTLEQTILKFKKAGDRVNIEVDFLAKYVEQFVHPTAETKLTAEWLKQQGY
ncbi:MAG: riboflavin synthase [candidate division KSB1 bacterium]|nr:riboflavin synthase [candidate division KSB1 bacterium]MDZ7340469.1 riboflavin synthase [candidate division KSB1 bacterium]